MSALVDDGRWQRRAARARRLGKERPAVAETLSFYASLAELQGTLLRRYPPLIAAPSSAFADRIDVAAALGALPEFLGFIKHQAPAAFADGMRVDDDDGFERWRPRVHTYWISGGRDAGDANPVQRFVLDALLSPFAEAAVFAIAPAPLTPSAPQAPSSCEVCTGMPVVALLREQAHGAKRSLVCGFCLREWSSPRLECLQCGETAFESLPVFRSDQFHAVRIDACDSCKTYVKTIDLTRDGEASPIVDDIASMPLDVWAREKEYRRFRANLFGF